MKPIQNLKLAFRCGEDLEQMSPCDGGKFCGVCDKKVFDFRWKGQEELDRVLKENGSVCGMFTADQMKEERKRQWFWKQLAASVLIALGLGSADNNLFAQTKTSKNVPDKPEKERPGATSLVVFGAIEVLPQYKNGGDAGFARFIKQNLKNPENIQGKVIVSFRVDTTGKVFDIRVLRGLSEAADKEAVRVVALTEFKPYKIVQKEKGAVAYTCPISFVKNTDEI